MSVTEQLEQIISKISALAHWPHLSQGGLAHCSAYEDVLVPFLSPAGDVSAELIGK